MDAKFFSCFQISFQKESGYSRIFLNKGLIDFQICISAPYLDKSYDFCPVESFRTHGLERWWICLKIPELLFHSSHRPQQHPRAEHPLENKIQHFRTTYFRKSVRKLGVIFYITAFKAALYRLISASSWLDLLIATSYMEDFIALLRVIIISLL